MGAYLSYQKKEKFFVILCGDVLLEVLQFGNRGQLVKLERVGRRLHWIVENFYGGRPFLRLGLSLYPSGNSEALITGNTRKQLCLANLTSVSVPRFIRFNEVKLFYNYSIGPTSIEEKCRSIENYLQPLKEALNDSISIRFHGDIVREDQTDFSDHSKLLNCLSEQLLKICNSSREYDFSIYFGNRGSFSSFFRSGLEPLLGSEAAEVAANIINSIIQMPQTCRCSCLRINLCFVPQPVLLPVEEISSWLNRTIGDGMNFIGRRTPQEIFLRIYATRIQNVVEMCDHLVKTFKAAKAPALAYTFQLGYFDADIEEQRFQNTKTNEELSIHHAKSEIVIKRVTKKKN